MGYERAGDYVAVVRRIGRVFFDVDEWFDFVRGQDLVVGTRLHGVVAALLQGVPAIVLYHDSRTREICELFGVPRLSVAPARGLSLDAIYDRVDFDELTPRHAALIPRYVDFLERNGFASATTRRSGAAGQRRSPSRNACRASSLRPSPRRAAPRLDQQAAARGCRSMMAR